MEWPCSGYGNSWNERRPKSWLHARWLRLKQANNAEEASLGAATASAAYEAEREKLAQKKRDTEAAATRAKAKQDRKNADIAVGETNNKMMPDRLLG
jgi:hypothetical protein